MGLNTSHLNLAAKCGLRTTSTVQVPRRKEPTHTPAICERTGSCSRNGELDRVRSRYFYSTTQGRNMEQGPTAAALCPPYGLNIYNSIGRRGLPDTHSLWVGVWTTVLKAALTCPNRYPSSQPSPSVVFCILASCIVSVGCLPRRSIFGRQQWAGATESSRGDGRS